MAYIYQHIRKDNDMPFYIGVGTKSDNYKRAYSYKNRNQYWHNIVLKYGYYIKILEDNLSIKNAFEREIFYIDKYKRKIDGGILCNISIGGNGGNLGDIINLKKSIKLRGHFVSQETKNKIKQKAIGRKLSNETKIKMSKTHKENKTGHWLKSKGSDNGNAYKVEQLDINKNLIKIWDCSIYASSELKINKSSISSVLNGKQKTAGGYIWRKHQNYAD